MKKPKYTDLTHREADELVARLSDNNLSKNDIQLIKVIIQNYIWVVNQLKKGVLRIKTLSIFLLGFRSEKTTTADKTDKKKQNDDETGNNNSSAGATTSIKKNGHGRNHSDKYHSKEKSIEINGLKPGSQCPEEHCNGNLYVIAPSNVVRIKANGLLESTKYILKSLRCALCGKVFRANLPKEAGDKKYSESSISWLGFYKYYAGLPFKRIETIQNLSGTPLPDATQWNLMSNFAQQVSPVYEHLMLLSSNSSILHADDTRCQILSLESENKRKAQYTTGIVSMFEDHQINLFMSGNCYSGENISTLLSSRSIDKSLIYMTDAHSMNNLKNISEDLLARIIVVYCLVHARRQFIRILDIFGDEVKHVLQLIAKIYANESKCSDQNYNNAERLRYHQKHSIPILNEWKTWMMQQLDDKLVEPNSSLGKAINYSLKRWDQLTRFTKIEGCPIDNNIVERALRIPIRLRKSAYFYKTDKGSLVGDIIMSLIYTCISSNQDPIRYCNIIQKKGIFQHWYKNRHGKVLSYRKSRRYSSLNWSIFLYFYTKVSKL